MLAVILTRHAVSNCATLVRANSQTHGLRLHLKDGTNADAGTVDLYVETVQGGARQTHVTSTNDLQAAGPHLIAPIPGGFISSVQLFSKKGGTAPEDRCVLGDRNTLDQIVLVGL